MPQAPAQPDHASRGHSVLSASGAERWTECLAQPNFCKDTPRTSSAAAEEGTAYHEVSEICIREGRDAIEFVDRQVHGFMVTADNAEAAQVYIDRIRYWAAQPGATLLIEHPVSLENLGPPIPMFGTSDAIILLPEQRLIVVVDLKFGKSKVVEVGERAGPRGNIQGKYYGLGALFDQASKMPGKALPYDRIQIEIVQPRAYHPDGPIRSEVVSIQEMREFAKWLRERAHLTQDPAAPFNPGKHCLFCPGEAKCVARGNQALSVAQSEFDTPTVESLVDVGVPALPQPTALTNAQISEVLQKAQPFEEWLGAVRSYAFEALKRGEDIPGFKLVEKRATRKWTDESDVVAKLVTEFGMDFESLYDRVFTLDSPAKLEQRIGKKAVKSFKDLIVSNSTGLTMAALADKRPAVNPQEANEFAALPGPDDLLS